MTEDEIKELEKYAIFEGSELGETLESLLHIKNYSDYVSDEFANELNKELKSQLKFFRKNCKIIKREVIHKETIEELEWNI